MNTLQRGRLIQLIKEYLPDSQPNDSDQTQWEIISEILNFLGPEQAVDQWKKEWETVKSVVMEKVAAIESTEEDEELPENLKLSEEDHRVIKICGLQNESQKIANLIKMLDCRAESPFQDDAVDESESHHHEDKPKSPAHDAKLSENANDSTELKSDKSVAQEQLDEQMTINGQLTELLAMLKSKS